MEEIDIWRTAHQMIQIHGEGAELASAQRADKAIEKGDPASERVWVRITKAVKQLMEESPVGLLN